MSQLKVESSLEEKKLSPRIESISIFSLNMFSGFQLPTRGHDEAEDSSNPGNWLTFISLQLKTNPRFRELNDKLKKNSKHSVNYYSKTSYNGFIEVIASETRLSICEEISHSKLFSVLIDESKDLGEKGRISVGCAIFLQRDLN